MKKLLTTAGLAGLLILGQCKGMAAQHTSGNSYSTYTIGTAVCGSICLGLYFLYKWCTKKPPVEIVCQNLCCPDNNRCPQGQSCSRSKGGSHFEVHGTTFAKAKLCQK